MLHSGAVNLVMKPLLGIVLQKCVIASNFPRDLVFTSLQYQGLGVRHPFYQQQIKHLSALLEETANHSSHGTTSSGRSRRYVH
jgi:hypothetical protein